MDGRNKEKASGLDAVFPNIEEFLSRKKDEKAERGRKRKLSVDHPKLSSVFTRDWREAVSHFAEKIPMGLLIQEFNRYYNVPISEGASEKDSKALVVVKGKRKDGKVIDFPAVILEYIFCMISLTDVLASRSVSDYWAAVYASRQFQRMYRNTEDVIVINNNNLDIWAFILASQRWVLLKIPCDWEELGMKTLGVKATAEGLYLVARSDFNLFIVHPPTARSKCLPRLYPDSKDRVGFLQSLIVHGTAEMQVDKITGNYAVYLFGNCDHKGENRFHLAKYTSTTKDWTIHQISLYGAPLFSTSFPSPLTSLGRNNTILCISSTFHILKYYFNNNNNNAGAFQGIWFLNTPIELKKHGGALPIMLPFVLAPGDTGYICVGRLKEDDYVKGMYGKLPIVEHFSLGIWRFGPRKWKLIHVIKAELIEEMIKSSEGTDFLVVGNGRDTIWLMLRGSESMMKYDIRTNELQFLPGCPGGGYMDASFHWKARTGSLSFNRSVGGCGCPMDVNFHWKSANKLSILTK